GEEPQASGDGTGDGNVPVNRIGRRAVVCTLLTAAPGDHLELARALTPWRLPLVHMPRDVRFYARSGHRTSSQLKVCNLSFSELSAWRSNTCVAMPEKSASLPSLSLPLALQFAVP